MTWTRATGLCFLICSLWLGVTAASAASPKGAPATLLLPNLVPHAPQQLFGPATGPLPSFGYGYPAPPVALSGCLADEIVRNGARRCLRFDTTVENRGTGPLEMIYRIEAPEPGAYQVLYRKDGGSRARFATGSEFHATHAHFHLRGFYRALLWEAARDRGKAVARGEKSGFCPEDGSSEGGGEARYRCVGDYRTEPLEAGQVVGISPGWSDAYRVHLPDQYIEISGVGDGRYVLELRIDPMDHVRESDESDNSTCSLISLNGERVKMIAGTVPCPGADEEHHHA